jgi:hypothetical protein
MNKGLESFQMQAIKDVENRQPWHDAFTENITTEMREKREELVAREFNIAGYGYLIDRLNNPKVKFPKVAIIRHLKWSYYFVDNDTPSGLFIVAVKDTELDLSTSEGYKFSVKFDWHNSYVRVPKELL